MKASYILLMIILIVVSSAFSGETTDPANAARDIQSSIVKKDVNSFNSFFYSENQQPSTDDLDYYFGKQGADGNLRDFLSRQSVRYVWFEHTVEKREDTVKTATIVYYDSDKTNAPSDLNWSKIGRGWLSEFAAVDVKNIDGAWYFDQTPFFFFRHAPWAGEYG